MKKALLIVTLFALTGCSLLPQAVSSAQEGAATAIVESSERVICRDIPIGTWLRMYSNSEQRLQAWRGLCIAAKASPRE